MKKSFHLFLALLVLAIMNAIGTGFFSYVSAWGSNNSVWLLIASVSGFIGLVVILLCLFGKKRGERGPFWLPMLVSTGFVIWGIEEMSRKLIYYKVGTYSSATANVHDYFRVAVFLGLVIAIYALFRYYIHLHRKSANLPGNN